MKKIWEAGKQRIARHCKTVKRHIKNHIIPSEENNHHPHVLAHRVLVGYSILLIAVKVFAIIASVALPAASLYSSSITPTNIVDLTNITRKNLGLDPLKINEKLSEAAQAKAQDMIAKQYFAHTSPEGVTPWFWFKQAGYKYTYAGENLAVHYTTAEAVEEGWLASPSHKANIVNEHYTQIGVGVAQGAFEGFNSTVVVQMFGTPAVQEIKPATAPVAVKPAPTEPLLTKPALVTSTPVIPPVTEPIAVSQETGEVAAAAASNPALAVPNSLTTKVRQPVIYDNSLLLKHELNAYTIRVGVANAQKVTAQLGSTWMDLTPDSSGEVWQGKITYDPKLLNTHGESLSIIALGERDTKVNKVVALIAPQASTQQIYNFSDSQKAISLFGWLQITNLNDSVKRFYIYFMAFLAGALLLNIFVKIHIQRPTVIGHALTVMVLAGLILLL